MDDAEQGARPPSPGQYRWLRRETFVLKALIEVLRTVYDAQHLLNEITAGE